MYDVRVATNKRLTKLRLQLKSREAVVRQVLRLLKPAVGKTGTICLLLERGDAVAPLVSLALRLDVAFWPQILGL